MKILVVEDDLTIQKQLKNLLSGNGYEVDTATDFSNVIEQVKAFAPHLVLLDIKLPGNSADSQLFRYSHCICDEQ